VEIDCGGKHVVAQSRYAGPPSSLTQLLGEQWLRTLCRRDAICRTNLAKSQLGAESGAYGGTPSCGMRGSQFGRDMRVRVRAQRVGAVAEDFLNDLEWDSTLRARRPISVAVVVCIALSFGRIGIGFVPAGTASQPDSRMIRVT
jgi:hypothetical protein